ncbi:hypothetical protein BAUCODRAFT_74767 [Baudoinia panamericana UAMH 10762]|uniref:DUF4048 domain-containing protein n=1 Tax=Baudoinia panamericana (strain UAMH 10762) TaxID=717646 RepID=M2LHX8_BAUPA|nr:uncharacterized protein BAUCODRAFT_74767 [Baudoinia panamericana UAMH 10762]EMC93787.1 hypothetical protein BAUCODRAFT_74767 [Baudoinia panamericana UAMH 10762]
MSVATESSVRSNRFSTSFPVQPAIPSSPTHFTQSPTREGPAVSPEALSAPTGPSDTNFLTAIAAQERKVLELREELQRAEAELNNLKRHWAQHEASKKRNDARRLTKLQPVQQERPTSVDMEEELDGSGAWMLQEMERRRALMNGGRTGNRRVFSSSRHTRTLSLLPPARDILPKLPPRKQSEPQGSKSSTDSERTRPTLLARASTTPDLTREVAEKADSEINLPNNIETGLGSEAIMLAGKKMATEFRDGLMTFWEDLRQATVGEEAIREDGEYQTNNPPQSSVRRQNSTPSPTRRHNRSKTQAALPDLADTTFWSQHEDEATPAPAVKRSPTARSTRTKTRGSSKPPSITSTDGWDAWEDHGSPNESRSSSAASETNTLPSSAASGLGSPRTSAEKKDPLPWPALSKLGPATLKRTASHLMREWERSLTPSPGREFRGVEDYLGLQSSPAAAADDVGKKKD